jgi:hypothetical protein
MLIVSSSIDPKALYTLMSDGEIVFFEDTHCTVSLEKGTLVGDSPYGYVDFMMPDSVSACESLVLWVKSWASFSPSFAC